MELCPIGAAGELCIGGVQLARGYLPTTHHSTSFIANPFGSEAAARLFKTGDLARFLDDGSIQLIGPKPIRSSALTVTTPVETDRDVIWAYWLREFCGSLPVLRLPTDRPKTTEPASSFAPASFNVAVSTPLFSALQDHIRTNAVSLHTVLLSAFLALLYARLFAFLCLCIGGQD